MPHAESIIFTRVTRPKELRGRSKDSGIESSGSSPEEKGWREKEVTKKR